MIYTETKPNDKSSIYWRWKSISISYRRSEFTYGYVKHLSSDDLIKLGSYENNNQEGIVVNYKEIEWDYQ